MVCVYFYAAAEFLMEAFRNAVRTMPRVSDGGQTSAAPAFTAAVHMSSSANRWVQTIQALGNSRDRCSTSEIEAVSMSRIAIPARCLAMLVRNSPRDWTWRTEAKVLARAETRDCATLESLWRSTTLRGCITSLWLLPLGTATGLFGRCTGVNASQTLILIERCSDRCGLLPLRGHTFDQGLKRLSLELPVLLQQDFHFALGLLQFFAASG